jgi:hypothetical protein
MADVRRASPDEVAILLRISPSNAIRQAETRTAHGVDHWQFVRLIHFAS